LFVNGAHRVGGAATQRPSATMFFLDPCGNALEFKAFADPERLFAT
jgi:extradiol dioxygenase family protein